MAIRRTPPRITSPTTTASSTPISHAEEIGSGRQQTPSEYFLSETQVRTDLEPMNWKVLQTGRDSRMVYVMIGIPREDLKKGPGHYIGTPFPGQPGNVGVAGHRTTYGAPFNRIWICP